MNVEQLAILVVKACEAEEAPYMLTGAFAYGVYGIPRSTKDVDVVLSVADSTLIGRVMTRLDDEIEFGGQVQFDTLTWGKRHVGQAKDSPQLQVELFELFEDAFVKAQFERRIQVISPQLEIPVWLPTAEDVVVQKIRWARPKDLDDARDVLAIQGTDALDMRYIKKWCRANNKEEQLYELLEIVAQL